MITAMIADCGVAVPSVKPRALSPLQPSTAAFDAGLYQPDGFQTEMACRTNQPGSIINASRETLDEGKVTGERVHQAPGEARDPRCGAAFAKQGKVEPAVVVGEEQR